MDKKIIAAKLSTHCRTCKYDRCLLSQKLALEPFIILPKTLFSKDEDATVFVEKVKAFLPAVLAYK